MQVTRYSRLALVVVAAAVMSRCVNGTPVTPSATPTSTATPTPTPTSTPIATSITVTGLAAMLNPGQTAQLTAAATLSDGSVQAVTAEATWSSGNTAVATVSTSGVASFVGIGETDIRAVYRSLTASAHVVVTAAPVRRYALTGAMTDADNRRGVENVRVDILDGGNAGRTASTAADGSFTIADLAEGTFTVRLTHPYYEAVLRAVTLSATTRLEVALKPVLNVSSFYGSYNIGFSINGQNCSTAVFPGPSGRITLEGRQDGTGVRIEITERGATRAYGGTIKSDGFFSGGGSGVILGLRPGATTGGPGPIEKHDFSGTIAGTVRGTSISGVENVTYGAPCPGGTAEFSFSGSK